MGIKENPTYLKSHQVTSNFFFGLVISSRLSRMRFELITRCLQVTNLMVLETNKSNPLYDKVGEIKWLPDEVTSKFQHTYNIESF